MTAGSKLMDAQAAYESSMTMQSVLLAGASYVFHAAGWLEGGLSASFAKFVLDAEQMEMYHRLGSGVDMSDLEEALDAVREVRPGGHFLGTAHTLAKFQTAFYAPKLLDNASFEQWTADGALDANQRALRRAQEMIRGYSRRRWTRRWARRCGPTSRSARRSCPRGWNAVLSAALLAPSLPCRDGSTGQGVGSA